VGQRLPLNALTSWDSLGQLINRYNQLQSDEGRTELIDPSISTVRDMFAHGRILKDRQDTNLTLVRLKKPRGGSVTVEGNELRSLRSRSYLVRLQLT